MEDSRFSRRDGAADPGGLASYRRSGSSPSAPGTGGGVADPRNVRDPRQVSAADLFALLWKELADILGTAAAATLLRRAAQRARPRAPELAALSIMRQGLEYRYTLPSNWTSPLSDPSGALVALAQELWPLLIDLTGSVVVQRLAQVPELEALAVAIRREPQP